MTLSKPATDVLIDLIENKLAVMHIGDRDDLRDVMALRTCLAELKGISAMEAGVMKNFAEIPRRGRRRKVSDMLGEQQA